MRVVSYFSSFLFLAAKCFVSHDNGGRENLHNLKLGRTFILIALLKLWELVNPGIKINLQERNFFSLVTIRIEIVHLL